MIEKSAKSSKERERFFDNIEDYHYWDKVEELYPGKYRYKKILVKYGLYDWIKAIVKL